MKKMYVKLLLMILMVSNFGFSQNQNTIDSIKEYLIDAGMNQQDINELSIQSQSFSKSMGVDNVYVVQQYKGILIKNVIGNFAVKNGKVVHFSGELVTDVASKINSTAVKLSPVNAVRKAASALGISNISNVTVLKKSAGNRFMISKSNISYDEIPVELVYELVNDKLILSWDLSIHALDGENWHSVRVDALSGKLISRNNWITSCSFDHANGINDVSRKDRTTSFGFKDKKESTNFLMDGTYNVFKIPAIESPNHGDRSLVTGQVDLNASPFGWHDTDGVAGAEFTTTRGNNVLASEDFNANNGVGYMPDGGADLIFDYAYDGAASVGDNRDASITNLFYSNNVIHDVWYQYGFDEASGNFQSNNYGKGGAGNDEVSADAIDGSSTNNATFGTPPDGGSPKMSMFIWNPQSDSSLETFVVNNTAIAGSYTTADNAFTEGHVDAPVLPDGITADLVLAVDNDPTLDPNDICSPLVNGFELLGKIAVVRRGECNFTDKVIACQDAGALAVLVINNAPTNIINMGGGDFAITIPAVMISQADGEAIVSEMASSTVNVTLSDIGDQGLNVFAEDGSFDNGIVIHEYGHGISTRLTGGANNSGCLSGDEQMGEGWSDWFALMMTIESGDTGADSRGIGTYATGQPTTGGGIRPFPYSTNTGINPVSYADTNNSASFSVPHGVGSIWASILWDMTWAFIDRDGFDSDLYNGTGGNNLAMQLVIDGLKLQACNPGFVDGRDGILAAADLLPNATANKCLIWGVFAARGLGFSADQGSSNSRSDQTEAFDLPPSGVLECNALGIDDFNEGVFNIHPNPSNGTFDINVAERIGRSTISIYDMNGRVVFKENTELNKVYTVQVDLGTGIYMLRIEADNGSAITTSKIVIK